MRPPLDYEALIAREAAHWGAVDRDPENPQLWDDPRLFEIALGPPYRHLVRRAVASGPRVLELGCGDGDLALELAAHGLDVTGVDVSAARVARARAQAERFGLEARARFEVGDLNVMELGESRYDCVVAHDALHHILRLEWLLGQVSKAMRPGGTLLVSDFIGVGTLQKLVLAAGLALLPTYEPYAKKWRRTRRLAPLLASERRKRKALEWNTVALLHDASPFEGISQNTIERRIAERFEVVDRYTFCPYWYCVFPRLRMPKALRNAILQAFQAIDRPLNRRGITRGAYCFVEARRST